MEGIILKGVGSFYTVLDTQGAQHICKARGRFRREGITPIPGDRVELTQERDGNDRIDVILPRKNALTRPAVANVDKLLIVLAASLPRPDMLLADKLLLQCELLKIRPLLLLNKCDMPYQDIHEALLADYMPAGYTVLCVSAGTGEGLGTLKKEMQGCICCFAGQSAVGKSSLVNVLMPELALPTGELSEKSEHGRHTTRHAELYPAFGGAVVDTPGFSLLDVEMLEPWELSALYPEMRALRGNCRFAECLHSKEPDCAVKAALARGELSKDRYARYEIILNELKEMRKHRYD